MSLLVESLAIPEIKIVKPKKFNDGRGYFSETYNQSAFFAAGVSTAFVQDNQSFSAENGTVRGLHFQTAPHAQDKLVRVVRGAIFDVAVDIRTGSPTFGKYVSAVVSTANWNQIFVPVGFAHGFMTLEPNTEVIYKVSNYYSPDHEKGLLWNDPALGIDWPSTANRATLSAKDKALPGLADLPAYFRYPGEQLNR